MEVKTTIAVERHAKGQDLEIEGMPNIIVVAMKGIFQVSSLKLLLLLIALFIITKVFIMLERNSLFFVCFFFPS